MHSQSLQEMAGSEHGGNGDAVSEAGSAASLDDGEFDKYLAELSQSGAGGDGGSSDAGNDTPKSWTLMTPV